MTTVAGTGVAGYNGDGKPATAARLKWPAGVAVDAAGDLYIADTDNHRVRRVEAGTGRITTVAGRGAGGYNGDYKSATAATLNSPWGVAVDAAGHLFIADTGNHRVRRVDAESLRITTVAGTGVEGYNGDNQRATAAQLHAPGAYIQAVLSATPLPGPTRSDVSRPVEP